MTSRRKPSRSSPSSRKPKRRAGSTNTALPMRQVALAEVKDDLSHPEFLRRVAAARDALKEGRGVRLEDLPP